jgi:hypothetical protein
MINHLTFANYLLIAEHAFGFFVTYYLLINDKESEATIYYKICMALVSIVWPIIWLFLGIRELYRFIANKFHEKKAHKRA